LHTGEPTRAAECQQKGLALAMGDTPGIQDLPPARTPVQPRSSGDRPKRSVGE
jgi:hypothetical protein